MQGDILLVAERFDDGWLRGIKMSNLEVTINLLIEGTSSLNTQISLSLARLDSFPGTLWLRTLLQSTHSSMCAPHNVA